MSHRRVHFSELNQDKQMFDIIQQKDFDGTNSDVRRSAIKAVRYVVENELTARQKQVIVLYYYEKYNMPEIAQMLGVNISTVSRTINRARKRMFDVLRYYFNQ